MPIVYGILTNLYTLVFIFGFLVFLVLLHCIFFTIKKISVYAYEHATVVS